jgi:hypothetical protein
MARIGGRDQTRLNGSVQFNLPAGCAPDAIHGKTRYEG